MLFLKRMKVTIFAAALFVGMSWPCLAADQALITLDKAKELVRNNSRVLNTTEITKDKLRVESEIAYDTYTSFDLQNTINGYVKRIKQLSEELEGLNPETDSDRINEIKVKIETYEQKANIIKKNLPDESIVSNYQKAWRATDEAYEDMPKVIGNTEKSLEFAVEKLYYMLLDLQNTIKLQNNNLLNMGNQLKVERLKVELGLSNLVSEKAIATQYTLLKNTISDLKSNERVLIWQLNDMMGRELDVPLQVIDNNVVPVKTYYSVDELYEKVAQTSLELIQKERQIENYNKDTRNEDDADQRQVLKQAQKIAEIELIDKKISVKSKVKSLIEDLTKKYQAWETAMQEVEIEKLNHDYNEVRFQLGLISANQKETGGSAYLTAVYKERQAARAWQLVRQQVGLAEEGILE